MSLSPPSSPRKTPFRTTLSGVRFSDTASASRGIRRARATRTLSPEEYAKAVQGYSRLPTGAGQNHISLGEFLTSKAVAIDIQHSPPSKDFVILYPLGAAEDTPASPSLSPPPQPILSDSNAEPDSTDERQHAASNFACFNDPQKFFRYGLGRSRPQSCIIFLRGFMSPAWINNIGSRYFIDPEFFCRHLDFRPTDDNSNNFSIPALPSSSWHLIELPVITIGTRMAHKGATWVEKVEMLRREGVEALASHHHRIAKLSSSGMAVGDSMVRGFHVFDETHFAIEQRISICMQANRGHKSFSLLIWLDSGSDHSDRSPVPWSVAPPDSYFLPVIRHKHMVALKCHLFMAPDSSENDPSPRPDQSASYLPVDYGRSLRSEIMARDAFYSLTEVFNFAASSQMGFLNLIDVKLDKYTSLPSSQGFQSLPNLKYTKHILYHSIQKTQRVLDSIRNAQHPSWLKDESESGHRKAGIAAKNLEQDFLHLLSRAKTLHQRTTDAIAVLMSSISISESQKAIEQAERVGRLTFLAFVFVPLSFTTSIFGMNIIEWKEGVALKWWFALMIPVAAVAMATFFLDVMTPTKDMWRTLVNWWLRRVKQKS